MRDYHFYFYSFFFFLQQIKEIKINDETDKGRVIKKAIWYLSISRNAIVVLFTSVMGYYWTSSHSPPFKLSGNIQTYYVLNARKMNELENGNLINILSCFIVCFGLCL